MSIWYFKSNKDPYDRLTNTKSHLYTHGVIKQLGVNNWDTYYTVANWMSIRIMLNLSILRYLRANSIDFVLA